MSEFAKTLTFVAVAAAVALVALVTTPWSTSKKADDETGELLVKDFDPLAVGSLEIVECDESTGELHPFQVAKADVNGKSRWSIPSHENYPTDAKDQFGEVVGNLTGLKILGTVADSSGRFEEFGVVDPDPKEVKLGDKGIGKRIVLKDDAGKELLALIIGKEVVDRPQNRYVRRVGENKVYEVAVKADKLTTRFDSWIDKNLLGMNSWDIKDLFVRDYAVDAMQGALVQHAEMRLAYNDAGTPKWKLTMDDQYVPDEATGEGKWAPAKLADDEEVNQARLDEMKTALDDLKIVDVRRKPKGLSANLKASGDFIKSRETVESLASKGFFAAKLDDKVELFSNNGETRVDMKDGVQYVLRFGGAAVDTGGPAEKGKDKPAGMNRYLFVMAEFNPDAIPKPELEKLPGDEPKPAEGEKATEGEKPAKTDEAKPEEGKADAPKPAESKTDSPKPEESKADEAKPEAAKADAPKAETKPSDTERQAIEKRNKMKTDEYEAKVKKGQDRVKELNARFADWYYVISEDVFKKIHLTREDIVKKKDPPKKEEGKDDGHDHNHAADPEKDPVGAFDALKGEGLKQDAP